MDEIKGERSSHSAAMAFAEKEKDALIQTKELMVQDMVSMNQNIVNERTAMDLMKDEIHGFKSIQAHIKAEILSEIRGMEIELKNPEGIGSEFEGIVFQDTNCINRDTVNKYFLRIPKIVSLDTNKWFSFHVTIDKSLTIDSLKMINKLDASLGWKKPEKRFKFLRKSEPVLALNSYNPYSSIPYVNNFTVEPNGTKAGKILNSRAAWFMYGLGVSTLIKQKHR